MAGPGLTSRVSPQDLACFVIDNNGFIVISERPQEVSARATESGGTHVTPLPTGVTAAGSQSG